MDPLTPKPGYQPINATTRKKIVWLLTTSDNMELETVINDVANSVHLDRIRAKHIKDSLAADVTEELGHAQQLAARNKILDWSHPGLAGAQV